jgi:hypothetical protein
LGSKTSGRECLFKRTISAKQRGCAHSADTGRARQLVGRVTTQGDEVRHLLGIDVISRAYFRRADPRHFAGAHCRRWWRRLAAGIEFGYARSRIGHVRWVNDPGERRTAILSQACKTFILQPPADQSA